MESDLIPYCATTALRSQSVLVLAPHPDDEVFGCGGAIARHLQDGVPVHVVILTDGALFGDAAVRQGESLAAAKVLGYGQPDFWQLPDRELRYGEALVARIASTIENCGADLVYSPSPWEVHPDHRQTCWLALEAVRRVAPGIRLAFYEVGSPLRPNVLVDITPLVAIKDAAMRCFASQLTQQDYARQISALNQYRSYTLPQGVLAAEALWVVNPGEFDGAALSGFRVACPTDALQPTVATHTDDIESVAKHGRPLVTIMIRSMDRPYLAEALDSISLQTYPHIEVLVQAVRPGHTPLPPRWGAFSVRLLKTDIALPRSLAANHLMAQAKGELLLFLDDDDWLMPGHIDRLTHVLGRQPNAMAAYTGISLVDKAGKPMGQCFDLPFDPIRQLAGNITPIHAVLFRASVLDQSCRFDESLDRFEDWDFWLQVAKLAPMVHLPGVSGAYRIHDSSGVHTDAGPAGVATALVYEKWASRWTPLETSQIMQRVWSHPDLELRLEGTRQHLVAMDSMRSALQHNATVQASALAEQTSIIGRQQATIAQLQATLDQRDSSLSQLQLTLAHRDSTVAQQQLHMAALAEQTQQLSSDLSDQLATVQALLHSRSWRLTRPVRWLTHALRTSALGPALRAVRAKLRFDNQTEKKEMLVTGLIRKAYGYWRRYGTKTFMTRVRSDMARKLEATSTDNPSSGMAMAAATFLQPAPTAQSAKQLCDQRFDALTPLPMFLIPATGRPRINMVTDSIGKGSLFGGVGTALIFATLLANRLGGDLRIITRTEPPVPQNVDHLLSVYGIALTGEIQFKFAPPFDKNHHLDFADTELFITTSWWTTAATLPSVPAKSIVYLLQEDERMFYPFGDDRVQCEKVLFNPDIQFLINTRLLFDHFVDDGLRHLLTQGSWFEPAFPKHVFHPTRSEKAGKRKFVFYARPNNARNLFYLGIAVIDAALAQQVIDPATWDIILVGKDIPAITFVDGLAPVRLENLSWSDYADLAGTVDLALSLMYTPHPSYPPLDMAASGAVVVTNQFGNKQSLDAYSQNLICVETGLQSLVDGLRLGVALANDPAARAQNFAANRLCTDWSESLEPAILRATGHH